MFQAVVDAYQEIELDERQASAAYTLTCEADTWMAA
jgi:hypothetical protein